MSKNPTTQNNPSQANNITENDEKYKKFFYNTENLENIYNILKGEDKQLKKETVKRLIQDFEGVEYKDMKEENKNTSNYQKNLEHQQKIKIPQQIIIVVVMIQKEKIIIILMEQMK